MTSIANSIQSSIYDLGTNFVSKASNFIGVAGDKLSGIFSVLEESNDQAITDLSEKKMEHLNIPHPKVNEAFKKLVGFSFNKELPDDVGLCIYEILMAAAKGSKDDLAKQFEISSTRVALVAGPSHPDNLGAITSAALKLTHDQACREFLFHIQNNFVAPKDYLTFDLSKETHLVNNKLLDSKAAMLMTACGVALSGGVALFGALAYTSHDKPYELIATNLLLTLGVTALTAFGYYTIDSATKTKDVFRNFFVCNSDLAQIKKSIALQKKFLLASDDNLEWLGRFALIGGLENPQKRRKYIDAAIEIANEMKNPNALYRKITNQLIEVPYDKSLEVKRKKEPKALLQALVTRVFC